MPTRSLAYQEINLRRFETQQATILTILRVA